MKKYIQPRFKSKDEKKQEKVRLKCLELAQPFEYSVTEIVESATQLYDFVVFGPKEPEPPKVEPVKPETKLDCITPCFSAYSWHNEEPLTTKIFYGVPSKKENKPVDKSRKSTKTAVLSG